MRVSIRSLLISGAAAALLVTAPGIASASDNSWELVENGVLSASAVYNDATNAVTVKDYEVDYLVPTLDIWVSGNPNGTHYPCATKYDLQVLTCAPINLTEDTRLEGKLCMRIRGTAYITTCTAVEVFNR